MVAVFVSIRQSSFDTFGKCGTTTPTLDFGPKVHNPDAKKKFFQKKR
jgi:hypothetical protein